MKRILIVLICIISLSLMSCRAQEIESDFIDVVESKDAIFTVRVDSLSITSVEDSIKVDIEMKAKTNISSYLPTTSYGDEYLIQMRNTNTENEDMRLDTSGNIGNCAVGFASIKKNETLNRSFSIFIETYFLGDKQANNYNGEYRIDVMVYGINEWLNTDLVINVNISD